MTESNAWVSATVIMGGIYLCIVAPLALWTDRNLDFWCSYFKGQPVDVPYWAAFLATAFSNIFGIAGNVIAEILKFAV